VPVQRSGGTRTWERYGPWRERTRGAVRRLYAAEIDALLGFALRRVDRAEDAADAVAETFLVAWRRWDDVPSPQVRLWLYGVARRVLANQRRGEVRRTALGGRLRQELAMVLPDVSNAVVERDVITAAVSRLAERDREVLQLAAWEELTPAEIAEVLGVSAVAVRSRLSRSRARLRALVDERDRTRSLTLDAAADSREHR
jgi:RNA polymerase sigma factor (sigma-70 family)